MSYSFTEVLYTAYNYLLQRTVDQTDRLCFVCAGLPQVRPMGEVSSVAGEPLVISCPVAGYPIHTIKWFRGKS